MVESGSCANLVLQRRAQSLVTACKIAPNLSEGDIKILRNLIARALVSQPQQQHSSHEWRGGCQCIVQTLLGKAGFQLGFGTAVVNEQIVIHCQRFRVWMIVAPLEQDVTSHPQEVGL